MRKVQNTFDKFTGFFLHLRVANDVGERVNGQQGPSPLSIHCNRSFFFRQRCIFTWNGIREGHFRGKKKERTSHKLTLYCTSSSQSYLLGCKRLLLPTIDYPISKSLLESLTLISKFRGFFGKRTMLFGRTSDHTLCSEHWLCSELSGLSQILVSEGTW